MFVLTPFFLPFVVFFWLYGGWARYLIVFWCKSTVCGSISFSCVPFLLGVVEGWRLVSLCGVCFFLGGSEREVVRIRCLFGMYFVRREGSRALRPSFHY